jgi:hypothetical protein
MVFYHQHGGDQFKRRFAVSDFSSLPVSPEFVDILLDTASQTAVAYLEKTQAPAEIVALVRNLYELGYYLETCYRHPEYLEKERSDRYDIESIVIEAVNAIAQCGGVFQNAWNSSIPRETAIPVKVKKG